MFKKKVKNTYTCKYCHKIFQSYDKKRTYCSKECCKKSRVGVEAANYKGKIKIKCKNCGLVFKVILARKDKAKFCSYECYWNHNRGKTIITKKCKYCKKEFESYKYQNRKYCSNICQGKWMKENRILNNEWKQKIKENHSRYWLGKKKPVECRLKISQKNNWNWRGGISFEPYGLEFNNQLKEKIRKRDNYICCLCGLSKKNNIRKLSIHHIDYNKKNNKENNLITLCDSCHGKTNYNRNYWKNYYKGIINDKTKV